MSQGAVLMVQGTASSAGKSFLVAGLCRLFEQEGVRVAPFKAQNMSNNAAVTFEGHEIGRAQAVQALAARLAPHVDMNPVLLKPEADHRSQVIVNGRPFARLAAAQYQDAKAVIWGEVSAALDRLRAAFDLVIVEGAGSPAEINLKARDIANMRVALYAQAPVLIVGDIDRGGVFAHLFGTHHLLGPEEQRLVRGFVINRFRGDPSLLEPGLTDIEKLTGVPVVGVVPWIHQHGLPEEDAVALERASEQPFEPGQLCVAVVRLPRISNFDDFDPLAAEQDICLRYADAPEQLTGADLIVLPGTKATRNDLAWLREQGFPDAIAAAHRTGVPVVGICGGFQMLGRCIEDPLGVEGPAGVVDGLGMLDVVTGFRRSKVARQSVAHVVANTGVLTGAGGTAVAGYEIHAGITAINPGEVALTGDDGGQPLGAIANQGLVFGCYLHGLFANDAFRHAFLGRVAALRGKPYRPSEIQSLDVRFDRVADVLRSSLDLPRIFALAGREFRWDS